MAAERHFEQRFLDEEGIWLITLPGRDFEVTIAGDRYAPAPEHVATLEKIVPSIDSLTDRAMAYLDEFVDRTRFANGQSWFFEGLTLGREADAKPGDVTLDFSIEHDTYGFWSVVFRFSSGRFFPIKLVRAQT
ncbi:MAG TPA: hypothetical protein VFR18_04800 [Terriglobia bacterium]|nr:hypothetical protein [Terriglobia bacterium]